MRKAQPGGDNEGRRVPDVFGRCVHDWPRTRTVNGRAVRPVAVLATKHVCTSVGKQVDASSSTAARFYAHAISGVFAPLHTQA